MSKHNPEEEEHIQLLKLDSSPATGDSDDSDTETSSSTSSGQRRVPSHTDNNTYEIEGEVYTHEDLHPSTFSEIRAVARSYKQILLMTIVATIAIAAGAISATSHDHNGDGSYRTNAMGESGVNYNLLGKDHSMYQQRYIPKAEEQSKLSYVYRHGISTISSGADEPEAPPVHIQNLYKGDIFGHKPLPERFYSGIHVGLSNYDVSAFVDSFINNSKEPSGSHDYIGQLKSALESFSDPANVDTHFFPPTSTHEWALHTNTTETKIAEGIVLFFSFEDMEDNHVMITTKTKDNSMDIRDFSAVTDMVEVLARALKCLTVHVWFPNQFGREITDNLHVNIIQEVKPIRSGLQSMKSSGSVWLMDDPF